MANTVTVEGKLLNGLNEPIVGAYVTFRVKSAGTDTEDDAVYPRKSFDLGPTDASGVLPPDDIWINGDSGVQSYYEIRMPDGETFEVVIPSNQEGLTLRLDDILENYQVTSSTQQSTTLSTALAYTDTLAADPRDNTSFNTSSWRDVLEILPALDVTLSNISNNTVSLSGPRIAKTTDDNIVYLPEGSTAPADNVDFTQEGFLPDVINSIVTVRSGTASEIAGIVLEDDELAIITENDVPVSLVAGDGATAGGFPLLESAVITETDSLIYGPTGSTALTEITEFTQTFDSEGYYEVDISIFFFEDGPMAKVQVIPESGALIRASAENILHGENVTFTSIVDVNSSDGTSAQITSISVTQTAASNSSISNYKGKVIVKTPANGVLKVNFGKTDNSGNDTLAIMEESFVAVNKIK